MPRMSPANDFRVTLLGTGTPAPRPDRFGPSTLAEAGGQKLLIDAGRGATIRLYQLGVPLGRLDGCCSPTITPTTPSAFPTVGSPAGCKLTEPPRCMSSAPLAQTPS